MLAVTLLDIFTLRNATDGKKTILFGPEEFSGKIEGFLLEFGIRVSYAVTFSDKLDLKDGTTRKRNYLDLMSEESDRIYIICTGIKSVYDKYTKMLLDMGFVYLMHFNYIQGAAKKGMIESRNAIDPNLGYGIPVNVVGDDGVKIFGETDDCKLKIAIIGNSIADSNYYPWKTWPEILYEILHDKGINATVISAGTIGYTSSQCVIKYVRDVLRFMPDISINYCTIDTDAIVGRETDSPYVCGYQRRLLPALQGRVKDYFKNQINTDITYGNRHKQDTLEALICNIRNINALSNEYGIKHICILPPSLFFKRKLNEKEYECYYSCNGRLRSILEGYYRDIFKYIEELKLDFVYDCRNWMDQYENVFYDWLHMYEFGNSVIANKVYRLLDEKGILD